MKILLTEEQFAIEADDGEQGEFVDYGEVATLTRHATERYIALCDDPDGTPELYCVSGIVPKSRTLEAEEFEAEDVEVEAEESDDE